MSPKRAGCLVLQPLTSIICSRRSVGAVAALFDISCLYGKSAFDNVPEVYQESTYFLGEHYFIANPVTGTGISPKWDFAASGHGYVVGARSAGIPAPTGSQDVDWLFLTSIQGSLADEIYRVDTRGGQPPASV